MFCCIRLLVVKSTSALHLGKRYSKKSYLLKQRYLQCTWSNRILWSAWNMGNTFRILWVPLSYLAVHGASWVPWVLRVSQALFIQESNLLAYYSFCFSLETQELSTRHWRALLWLHKRKPGSKKCMKTVWGNVLQNSPLCVRVAGSLCTAYRPRLFFLSGLVASAPRF